MKTNPQLVDQFGKPIPRPLPAIFVPDDEIADEGFSQESPPLSQQGTRGCNIVAATAVLAFAAVFIGLIFWILSFTP